MQAAADVRGKLGRVRLGHDVAQRAGLRTGAIQCSLRAGQGFDAFQVDGSDIRRLCAGGQRLLVQVNSGRSVGDVGPNGVGQATEHDLVEARRRTDHGHRGYEFGDILQTLDADPVDLLLAESLDRLRDVLDILFALAGRYGDFLQCTGGILRFAFTVRLRQQHAAGTSGQRGGDGGEQLAVFPIAGDGFQTIFAHGSLQLSCPGLVSGLAGDRNI